MIRKLWSPDKTVFVQIGDHELKTIIESWAAQHGLEVFLGSGCDLIAVGYLFAIVERESVGVKVWSDYLVYLQESEDSTPCIVLDKSRNNAGTGSSNIKFEIEAFYTNPVYNLDNLLAYIDKYKLTSRDGE